MNIAPSQQFAILVRQRQIKENCDWNTAFTRTQRAHPSLYEQTLPAGRTQQEILIANESAARRVGGAERMEAARQIGERARKIMAEDGSDYDTAFGRAQRQLPKAAELMNSAPPSQEAYGTVFGNKADAAIHPKMDLMLAAGTNSDGLERKIAEKARAMKIQPDGIKWSPDAAALFVSTLQRTSNGKSFNDVLEQCLGEWPGIADALKKL